MRPNRSFFSRRVRRPLAAACTLALGGCIGIVVPRGERRLSDAAIDAGLQRFEVDTQTVGGISDMALVRDGNQAAFWLVPERQRGILAVSYDDVAVSVAGQVARPAGSTQIWPTVPVVTSLKGVPHGLDTEALALLTRDRWLLGTESSGPNRTHDAILLVEPRGAQAEVVGQIDVPWDLWDLRANSNEGIEGLCSAGNFVLFAGETAGKLEGGGRFAPLGLKRVDDPGWTPLKLKLTSNTGKISALTCRLHGATQGTPSLIEVVAIERHFRVSRVLRFFVAAEAPRAQLIEASDSFDLTNWLDPLPNYEGIAWLNDDTLLLISDNSMAVRSGPTEALVVPMQNLAPVLPTAP
jgi:hypothetical protein